MKQKFEIGEEVYIRPIYEGHMIHFDCDLITEIKGTYGQLYGGSLKDRFRSYSTAKASWYEEDQIVRTYGRSLEECREDCFNYWGKSYDELMGMREKAWQTDPLRQSIDRIFKEFCEAHFLRSGIIDPCLENG